MRSSLLIVVPCAMLLAACSSVPLAYKDIGTRSSPCIDGGPDTVAQKFYDVHIKDKNNGLQALTSYRPYLSDSLAQQLQQVSTSPAVRDNFMRSDIFSSRAAGADTANVASASSIPNSDARNIPLRVDLKAGSEGWQDEVLMVREGQCWAVDDIRYMGNNSHAPSGSLRQVIEGQVSAH